MARLLHSLRNGLGIGQSLGKVGFKGFFAAATLIDGVSNVRVLSGLF